MSLIKSISGIRGTIGGQAGEGLNPLDIVKFTAAYATVIRRMGASDSKKDRRRTRCTHFGRNGTAYRNRDIDGNGL